jgi:very-short-patch-repair endonuclease
MKVGLVEWLSMRHSKGVSIYPFHVLMVTTNTIKREKFAAKQSSAAKYRKKLRKNPTMWEKKAFSALKVHFPQTIFQKTFFTKTGFYIVDFLVPIPYNVIVEIDGGHHYKGEMIEKDKVRDAFLEGLGYVVVRIKNKEVNYIDFKTLVQTAKKQRSHE